MISQEEIDISELKKANISAAVKENLVGAFISYELHTDIRNRKSATNICFLGKKWYYKNLFS